MRDSRSLEKPHFECVYILYGVRPCKFRLLMLKMTNEPGTVEFRYKYTNILACLYFPTRKTSVTYHVTESLFLEKLINDMGRMETTGKQMFQHRLNFIWDTGTNGDYYPFGPAPFFPPNSYISRLSSLLLEHHTKVHLFQCFPWVYSFQVCCARHVYCRWGRG